MVGASKPGVLLGAVTATNGSNGKDPADEPLHMLGGHEAIAALSAAERADGTRPAPRPNPLDKHARQFRERIIRALLAVDRDGFTYIDSDRVVGTCPACGVGDLAVRFHGQAPRADLECSLGCDECDVVRKLARGRA